jgi:hypothetical protein
MAQPLPARAGSYETYGDFIRAIADVCKKHPNSPNSSVAPEQILDHTAYLSPDVWKEKRNNYLAVEDALNGDHGL